MKRLLVIIFAIVCGVAYSDGFAKKPKKQKLSAEEKEAKIDSLRKELEKELEREKDRIVYIDTIRIDSIKIPIYYDYNHRMLMPMILYENPVMYIEFAFCDTDKSKYYCATGRGESSSYSEAKHAALEDAVLKVQEEAGNGGALDSAELLMTEEDRPSKKMMKVLEQVAIEHGDTARLSALKESENVHKVVVAIRIPK